MNNVIKMLFLTRFVRQSPPMNAHAREYMSQIGKRGGKSRSLKKLIAVNRNLKLARKRKAGK